MFPIKKTTTRPKEFKNPDHEKTGYEKADMSYPDRFIGQPSNRVQKVQRRTRLAVEDPEYRPDYSPRRRERQLDMWLELAFNGRHRKYSETPYFRLYTSPEFAKEWKNRKFRAYRKIRPGPRKLAGEWQKRRAARYERVKNGHISTDFILSDFELGKIRASVGREQDEARLEEERRRASIVPAPIPHVSPEIARILGDLHAKEKVNQARADAAEETAPPRDDDGRFQVYRWEEKRREASKHNKRLERELVREGEGDMWIKPGDQVYYDESGFDRLNYTDAMMGRDGGFR